MKRNFFYSLIRFSGIIASALLLFISCEEMVSDVEAPVVEPKLVLTSFISPAENYITAKVQLSSAIYTSRPSFSDTSRIITDASVWISNGTDSIQLLYNPAKYTYRVSSLLMPIIKGETYYMTVTSGKYSARAECTIPAMDPPYLEVQQIEPGEYQSYILDLRFQDIPEQVNYYRVAVGHSTHYDFQEDYIYEVYLEHGEPFVSDKNMDGEYFSYTTSEIYANAELEYNTYLVICNTDEHYYKYHKGIEKFDDENPFAEPDPMYSNVKGGLGVFAGYTMDIRQIELR